MAGFMSANSVQGSYYQNFLEGGWGSINELDVYLRTPSGVSFLLAGPWSGQGWSTTYSSSTVAAMQGPLRDTLSIALNFSSDIPLTVDFYGWNGTTLVGSERGIYHGGGYSQWTWGTADQVTGPVIPEPTTMVAGALLLLPFGVSTLRMLRRRTA